MGNNNSIPKNKDNTYSNQTNQNFDKIQQDNIFNVNIDSPVDTPVDTLGWNDYANDTAQFEEKEIIDIGTIQDISESIGDNSNSKYNISYDSINNIMQGGGYNRWDDDELTDVDLDDMDTPVSEDMYMSKPRGSKDVMSETPESTPHMSEKDGLEEYDYGFSSKTSEHVMDNNDYGYSETSSHGFKKSTSEHNEDRISTSSVNTEDLDFIFERNSKN